MCTHQWLDLDFYRFDRWALVLLLGWGGVGRSPVSAGFSLLCYLDTQNVIKILLVDGKMYGALYAEDVALKWLF